jgi:hypothetical protein
MASRPFLSGPLGKTKAKGASKAGKGAKGALFDPGGTAAQLWMRNPDKRKVDLSGVLFGPEDTIIAVARGMHPGVLRDMDDRATIRGALTVLKALGVAKYAKVRVETMKSTLANSKADDAALLKAAGASTLRVAANRMRQEVHKHHLDRAAWGMRSAYVLDNLKGFNAGRAVATTIVGAIPIGVTQAVAAAMAVHGAISGAIAKDVLTQATTDAKEGLAAAKARAAQAKAAKAARDAKKDGKTTTYSADGVTTTYTQRRDAASAAPVEVGASPSSSGDAPAATSGLNPWWIGGLAAVVLVGGALMLRRKA